MLKKIYNASPIKSSDFNNYVPPTEGGGHIVFGADPVSVASFQRDIF